MTRRRLWVACARCRQATQRSGRCSREGRSSKSQGIARRPSSRSLARALPRRRSGALSKRARGRWLLAPLPWNDISAGDLPIEGGEDCTIGLRKLEQMTVCRLLGSLDPIRQMGDVVTDGDEVVCEAGCLLEPQQQGSRLSDTNPYPGACAKTLTNPSSVIEQVAKGGNFCDCIHLANRSWNS